MQQLRGMDSKPAGTEDRPQQALGACTMEARQYRKTGSGTLEYHQWAMSLEIKDFYDHRVLLSGAWGRRLLESRGEGVVVTNQGRLPK